VDIRPLIGPAKTAFEPPSRYAVAGGCYRGDVKLSEAEGLMLGAYDIPGTRAFPGE
jgi:hypothetical protein